MTPTSTAEAAFLEAVKQQFTGQRRGLVVVRYVYGAGSKDFVLLDSFDEFSQLLCNLKQRDSVIVMKAHHVVLEGTVDQAFINDALLRYQQRSSWILIGPDNYEYTADWAYAESLSELREELEDRIGNVCCIVDEPNYISDSETIDAYVPDADGIVRPGAY